MRDEPPDAAHLSSRWGGEVSDDLPAGLSATATLNGQMSLASLPRLLRDDTGLTQAFGNPAAVVAVPESGRAVTVAALAQLGDRHPLLVATPTGTDAGQLYDDLCQFMPPDSVVLFPAWETLPF